MVCRVCLYFFPFQSFRLKSPAGFFHHTLNSVCIRWHNTSSSLKFVFSIIHPSIHPSIHTYIHLSIHTLFFLQQCLQKAFYAQGTMLCIGNTMFGKNRLSWCYSHFSLVTQAWNYYVILDFSLSISKSTQAENPVKFVLRFTLSISTAMTLPLDRVSSICFSRSSLHFALCPWHPAGCS